LRSPPILAADELVPDYLFEDDSNTYIKHVTLYINIRGGLCESGKAGCAEETHHRVDQLYTIVLGGIMAGSDHDSDGAVSVLGSNTCEYTYCIHHVVKSSFSVSQY
jgi:hypothetical protein